MKGVSKEIITTLVVLIIVSLFLVLMFTIFKRQLEPFTEMLKNIFKNLLRMS